LLGTGSLAKQRRLPGYEPDAVLGAFTGWPILFVRVRGADADGLAAPKGQNTLARIR
jgi:hypothetical protein